MTGLYNIPWRQYHIQTSHHPDNDSYSKAMAEARNLLDIDVSLTIFFMRYWLSAQCSKYCFTDNIRQHQLMSWSHSLTAQQTIRLDTNHHTFWQFKWFLKAAITQWHTNNTWLLILFQYCIHINYTYFTLFVFLLVLRKARQGLSTIFSSMPFFFLFWVATCNMMIKIKQFT